MAATSGIGTSIRSVRTASGMSQKALAESAGIARGFLCDIEKGRTEPSIDTLARLADALRMPMSALAAVATEYKGCRHWYVQTDGKGTGRCADCGAVFGLVRMEVLA